MVMGRLSTLSPVKEQLDRQLNETLPLLYACLKIAIKSGEGDSIHIRKLDDFIKVDPEQ